MKTYHTAKRTAIKVKDLPRERGGAKFQALVYDILPSTIAVFSYAIGSRKLSANEQFLLVLKQ